MAYIFLLFSALAGYILDNHFHFTSPAFFWFIGVMSGIISTSIIFFGEE